MGGDYQEKKDGLASRNCSKLLELAAIDDLSGFISEVEEKCCDVDALSYWYGRKIGSRKMGFEERTPIMVAALYGSIKVVEYILGTGKVDVNKARGSDGVTALHCAVAGGSEKSAEVVRLLIEARIDITCVSANGKRPCELIPSPLRCTGNWKRKPLEILLKGEEEVVKVGKKEYPIDVSLPDINSGIYGEDEFRMYNFKVKPCSRAYSHDWTECPFVHPGENARRRDPRKFNYTCVPCPDFKKGSCVKGDTCEYAHGVFESWLHPAQYRTRLCKDETGCSRKVCFFAHKHEELRPMCPSTGSAMPSPNSRSSSSGDVGAFTPLDLCSNSMFRTSYPSNISSSPIRKPSPYGFDSHSALAASVMNSRSAAFAKRSQSFIERTNSPTSRTSNFEEWSSPDGKLDWGFNGQQQQHMFQRSISVGYHNGNIGSPKNATALSSVNELYLQRDVPSTGGSRYMAEQRRAGIHDMIPPWLDQLYREQEKIMA